MTVLLLIQKILIEKSIDSFRKIGGNFWEGYIILNNFCSLDKNDGDEIEKMLFELHRILTTFEWHFSEISDLNTTILKVYKDTINNI